MQSAIVCCEQYRDVHYRPIEFNDPQRIAVGAEGDPVRRFAEGISYFAAFDLPVYERAYELRIVSEPVGDQLFIPTVVLLDDNYREIHRIEPDVFEYSNGVLKHAFFINYDQREASYLIVYARKDDSGNAMNAVSVAAATIPITGKPFVFYYTHHREVTSTIRTAPGGRLEVTATLYAPRIVGQDNAKDADGPKVSGKASEPR
ncbi:MAG: hypothetical protein CALGDGBN_00488 [Pseudomonadales bacterium]|nr:hypothetical protein [Pseudomonadales bacterium]